MRKILKAILISIYCALLLQLFKLTLLHNHEEVIEINYILRTPGTLKRVMRDIKKNKGNLTGISTNFTIPIRLPNDYKYILKWTRAFSHFDSPVFRNGQRALLDYNCTYNNCFITDDKSLLIDIRYFDAIIFDIENTWDKFPPLTRLHQALIFSALEPSAHDPVCDESYENYFHLTWTYKLDSDISNTYVTILDTNGTIIGPRINMSWIEPMKPTSDGVKMKLKNKNKAVAWFVSNCHSENRQRVARDLNKALDKVNLRLDVYGGCGNLTCPRDRMEDCLQLLQDKYYFYLAFENSLCEDYVTEKVLYPLMHFTVPIVYGGADYSRFLPPNSYINAGQLAADEIVSLILEAMRNRTIYHNYFRWHNHYTYRETPQGADVCTLCLLLNKQKNFTTIKNIRKWWNPDYKNICTASSEQETDFDFV